MGSMSFCLPLGDRQLQGSNCVVHKQPLLQEWKLRDEIGLQMRLAELLFFEHMSPISRLLISSTGATARGWRRTDAANDFEASTFQGQQLHIQLSLSLVLLV